MEGLVSGITQFLQYFILNYLFISIFISPFSKITLPTILAGLPITTEFSGTLLIITQFAPTYTRFEIFIPLVITVLGPIKQLSPIIVGLFFIGSIPPDSDLACLG